MNDDDRAPRAAAYKVLARKYRPSSFAELIGQDALVRTLTNAFRSGRLAHAYMLSGVRGIGKTTTARIIARALNCIGPDGSGGPTAEPCGVCEPCRSIAEDRHIDVLEMDAASRTGVDDIRELIEGVRYRPAAARYKVYIIDEVHMLSRNAFNALLKTLEEPPAHVRFVFATTEIRKVPVTVLSRCQRFDLRRVDAATLTGHLAAVCAREGAVIADAALQLIARAADGSVRDALSLLDQAIAHADGEVGEEAVRSMLGLADRGAVFDLLDAVMGGETKAALDILADQYAAGADPGQVLEDLLGVVHWLTRLRIAPNSADAPGVPEFERVRGRRMAAAWSMGELTRAWQMVLKGLNEVRFAPAPLPAAEMVLVRLAFAARLPTPAEALRDAGTGATAPPSVAPRSPPALVPVDAPPAGGAAPVARSRERLADPSPAPAPSAPAEPRSFADVVELAARHDEAVLYGHLVGSIHLVAFEPPRIAIRLGAGAPADLPRRLARFLGEHTGHRWLVSVSQAEGASTLLDAREAAVSARRAQAAEHPLVRAILERFPGAEVTEVRDLAPDGLAPADTDDGDG